MRHLPVHSVDGADVGGKILVNEDPGLADLCSRYVPELGLGAQPFGMTTEKDGGLRRTECLHVASLCPHQAIGKCSECKKLNNSLGRRSAASQAGIRQYLDLLTAVRANPH